MTRRDILTSWVCSTMSRPKSAFTLALVVTYLINAVFYRTELLDIICNVSELFLEHPALIQGFNRLLPQGYYIHYAPGDFNHHFVSVTLPSGDTIQIIGNPPRHDISAQPKPAPCTSSLSPESSRGRSLPPVFPGSGTKPSSRMHGSGARGPGLGAGRIETENDWSEPVVLGDASAGVR